VARASSQLLALSKHLAIRARKGVSVTRPIWTVPPWWRSESEDRPTRRGIGEMSTPSPARGTPKRSVGRATSTFPLQIRPVGQASRSRSINVAIRSSLDTLTFDSEGSVRTAAAARCNSRGAEPRFRTSEGKIVPLGTPALGPKLSPFGASLVAVGGAGRLPSTRYRVVYAPCP